MSELRTDFKDEILQEGEQHRIYNIKRKGTDEVVESDIYLEKAYEPQQEGDNFGAKEVNEINAHLNVLAGRNLLINGDFQVWQRGVSVSIGSDKWYYTADRFRCKGSGTVEKVSNGLKVSASTDIQYIMEDLDFNKINGQTVTLSYSKNDNVITSTFTCSSAIVFDITLNANDILNWVKLEGGNIATQFVPRLYAVELLLCQRYFVKYEATTDDLMLWQCMTVGKNARFVVILPTSLRTVPTIQYDNVVFYNHNTIYPVTNIRFLLEGMEKNILNMQGDTTTNFSISSDNAGFFRIQKGGYLAFDAEIY